MAADALQGRSNNSSNPVYNSDLIADILASYEVEYIAANIGSTFRSLWDSIVNYGGDTRPKTIACCHEEVAVAIAHGYAKASGKPMVALVHDTVGLLHASMAIYNAWCDRVPVLVIGATGPMNTDKRRPWIDWIHNSVIPNETVRHYVKWDDFALTTSNALQSFARAYRICMTDPKAPVFICLDCEDLEQKIGSGNSSSLSYQKRFLVRSQFSSPTYPSVDRESLVSVSRFLLEAEHPFIVAGTVGRNNSSVKSLVSLAEATGSSVIDTLERFNFPNSHFLDAPDRTKVSEADRILALDCSRLEWVLGATDAISRSTMLVARPDMRIGKIGLEDLLIGSWSNEYQGLVTSEFSILADTSDVIQKLADIGVELTKQDSALKKNAEERLFKAKLYHEREKERQLDEAKKQWNDVPISLPRLAGEVWEKITESRKHWVISNGLLNGWVRKLWELNEPGCFLGGSGGAGLGYGLPASIGAALAKMNSQDRDGKTPLVIDFQPDGDLLYTSSSLWTAAHYHIPLLIIMFNNRLYYNDAEHNRAIARARQRDEENAFHIGGDIADPVIDFAQLARSQGVHGEGPVTRPEELSSSIEKALFIVERNREPALVDVVTKAR